MKFRILALAVAALFVLSGCAMFSGLMGGGASPELKNTQNSIVSAYDGSFAKIYEAQIILLEALDLKEQAAEFKAKGEQLKQGNTNKGDKAAQKDLSEQLAADVKKALDESGNLTKEQSEKAQTAIAPFIKGNAEAAGMIAISAKFMTDVANVIAANPTQALSLKSELVAGMTIAQLLPDYVKVNTGVISSALALLKKSGVDTSAMDKASKDAASQGAE